VGAQPRSLREKRGDLQTGASLGSAPRCDPQASTRPSTTGSSTIWSRCRAGADFRHAGELVALDGLASFDAEAHAAQLADVLAGGGYALVFEHLMDISPATASRRKQEHVSRALSALGSAREAEVGRARAR
jgi:hypothetical protein